MDGWVFWTVAVLAAILTGFGKGGMPMVGTLTVPVLSLAISPVAAAGLLLPVYVVSDWFGLWAYRKEFDRRVLLIMSGAMTIGVGLGWATASYVAESWVTLLVGLIGVGFSLNQLLRPKLIKATRQARILPGLFWGTIAGFTSFVSHTGGPPYQVYTLPLGLRKAVFAGTSTIAFTYINALKLIPYYMLGQINLASLETGVLLMPAAIAAVFVGVWAVRRVPERLFFRIVTWSLLVVSVDLIWKGWFSWSLLVAGFAGVGRLFG